MIARRTFALALLALLPALPACDDDATGPDEVDDREVGTFDATLSGDLSAAFDGDAVFGTIDRTPANPDDDEELVVVSLRESPVEGDFDQIVLVGRDAPTEGTYTLVGPEASDLADGEWYAVYVEDEGDDQDYERFVASGTAGVAGTVTFTDASASEVNGTVDFTGNGFFGSGTVDVSAAFSAETGLVEHLISD